MSASIVPDVPATVSVTLDAVAYAAARKHALELAEIVAEGVTVESAEDLAEAERLAGIASKAEADAVELRQAATKGLGDWKRKIDARFKADLVDPFARVKAACKGAIGAYLEKQEAARRAATERAQAAVSAGDVGAVATALAEVDAADAGGSFEWVPRVTNLKWLVGVASDGTVPLDFVQPNYEALNVHAKKARGDAEPEPVPGVLFERRAVVRVRKVS